MEAEDDTLQTQNAVKDGSKETAEREYIERIADTDPERRRAFIEGLAESDPERIETARWRLASLTAPRPQHVPVYHAPQRVERQLTPDQIAAMKRGIAEDLDRCLFLP